MKKTELRNLHKNHLQFSKWVKWELRADKSKGLEIALLRSAGIYQIARTNRKKGPAIDCNDNQIIYIGETGVKLRERWNKFNNSALSGSSGHCAGHTYRTHWKTLNNVWVRAIAINNTNPAKRLFLERLSLMYFVVGKNNGGQLPLCNKK
jgi:hypothetical protein